MILAAGFGTRLGELGRARPKPMLPVVGAPLVRWAVLWLRHHGVREIVVNLHHHGDQIEAELGDGSRWGVAIAYSREHGQILGTGGGLRQARPLLDDGHDGPIVVMNGKILLDLDLGEVVATHRASAAEATMVLRPDAEAERWGSFAVADDGRIVAMLGRTPPPGSPPAVRDGLMFTGVHVIQPHFLDRVPPEGEQCIVRTAYRGCFDAGTGLRAHVTERYWWEHSTEARYLEGVCNVLDGKVALPFAEGFVRGVSERARIEPGAEIVAPVWIGPDVHVAAGARVGPHVQLEAGVTVGSDARVRRSVVWAGHVTGELVDSVVAHAPS